MRSMCVGNDAVRLELGMGHAAVDAASGSLSAAPATAVAAPAPAPAPSGGAVLVRVGARGVARSRTRRWAQDDLPPVIRYDLSSAGSDAVPAGGPSATWFTPEIFGDPHRKHARYLVTDARSAAGAGADDRGTAVAASPPAAGAATETLLRRLDVRPGDSVLLHAGSATVGPFAMQLASARTPQGKLVTVLWSRAGRSAWTTVWRGNRAVPRRR